MKQHGEFEDVRKIGKVGRYSYCITIPKEIIRTLGWRNRQLVVVGLEKDKIVIRDWNPKKKPRN